MSNRHPLIRTLIDLKGNPRAVVLTEPLFGIPYNLYAPYASLYMLALGVSPSGIGLVASLGMVAQILFSLLSGALTDKFGRRMTTFIADLISISIPCLLLVFAQDIYWFIAAAMLGAVNRIAANSWGCLLVEDCDREQIIHIYTWIYVSGVVAAFFAPISGLFVGSYGLVATVRVLYMIALIMMTLKFIVLFAFSSETTHGKVRMAETRDVKLLTLLSGYRGVLGQILKAPGTLLTLALMLVMNICSVVNATFWSIFATRMVGVAPSWIGFFPFVRAAVMLLAFFTLVPRIRALRFRRPMLIGLLLFATSQVLLILSVSLGVASLFVSIAIEALALAMVSPLLDSMQVVLVEPKERARIISILYVCLMALSAPFGWIAGLLSDIDPRLPFLMNLVFLASGFVATSIVSRMRTMERM